MDKLQSSYELSEEIGKGSFSRIILARERTTGEYFAAKLTLKSQQHVPANYEKEREVLEILQKHPHPHIISTKEVIEDDEYLVFIQEYVPNGNMLAYLAANAPLAEDNARELVYQLVCAIEHLHNLGVCHRDIKLENVLVGADGAKLIDFNLSCFWNKKPLQTTFCGSQEYCSPEIFNRCPYIGPEIDSWSLGVLTYALLFCVFPFEARLQEELLGTCESDGECSDASERLRKRKEQIYHRLSKKVTNCEYSFPTNVSVSEEAREFLSSIFVAEGKHRPNFTQLRNHKWFEADRERERANRKRVSKKVKSFQDVVRFYKKSSSETEQLQQEILSRCNEEEIHSAPAVVHTEDVNRSKRLDRRDRSYTVGSKERGRNVGEKEKKESRGRSFSMRTKLRQNKVEKRESKRMSKINRDSSITTTTTTATTTTSIPTSDMTLRRKASANVLDTTSVLKEREEKVIKGKNKTGGVTFKNIWEKLTGKK